MFKMNVLAFNVAKISVGTVTMTALRNASRPSLTVVADFAR